MTQLYLNTAQDYLLLNGSGDWLLLDSSTATTFPTTPSPMEATVTSYSPVFLSVTHGLKRQVRSRGGHAWQIQFRYGGMTRTTAEPLLAFLTKQGGPVGTFTVSIPGMTNRGAGGGTPLVKGGSQTGSSLLTDGWPNNTAILKAGDFIQIESDAKVYKVTDDVTSDGSGNATIPIFPTLRKVPPDDFPIITSVVFTCALASESLSVDWDHCIISQGFTIDMAEIQ